MTSPRLGICFVPTLPPESLPDLARMADEQLDDLWVWEDCFKQSGLASAAVALALTERVRVGIGLMPAPLRAAPLAAMEIATLQRIFPGRFVPGFGHGVQEWMGQCGVRAASPMTLLAEYVEAVSDLLAGEAVTSAGAAVRLQDVRLDWPPPPGEALMVGGVGPKTVALAGRRSDGLLTTAALSDTELTQQRDVAIRARRDAGRKGDFEVVHTVIVTTGPGAQDRLDRETRLWGKEPSPTLGAAGTAEQVAARIREVAAAGATTVVAQPAADEPDVGELVAFLGGQVRPLLI